jgi:F0F1-type ATP synthase beta subunit
MELISNIVKAYRVYSNLAGTHERIDLYMKMKECRVIRKENIGVTLIYS